MKRLSTFLLALLLTWIGAKAQIESGTDYVIVNKEADQFLYGSYNWGCEASIGSKPVTFTVTESGDAYTLQANQWEGEHYVGDDFYTDKSSTYAGSITITDAGDGYYNLSSTNGYLIGNGKNKYTTVTANPGEEVLSSDAAKWKFVTEEEILAEMDDASSANPVDVSILISNPNFRPNGNGVTTVSNWTATNVTVGSYTNNYVQANCAESYEKGDFRISQTITLPKAGYYYLSAQGFYRDNNNVGVTAQMYAGTTTVDVPARRTTANTMAEAWAVFLEGSEPIDPIEIVASTAGETVEIGFTGTTPTSAGWAIFGEMTLMYYGETLTYAIGEPQCSATTVKPGSTVTITFPNCTTPTDGEEPALSTSANITVGSTAVADATLSYSGTTATVTFTMPSTIEYGTTVTVTVPAGLIYWDSTDVSSAAAEFTLTTPPFGDQSGVYLYSTHADGFLSRGGEHTASENTESYGKIATTDPYGIPVDITFGNDGLATVKFLDSNLFLYAGGWAWTDGSEANAAKYLVEEVTTGDGETVYQFSYDGNADNYLYVNDEYWDWVANNGNFNGDNNLNGDITRTYWQIFTMKERDDYKEAFVASQKAEIAKAVGADDLDSYIAEQPETDMTYVVADAALAGSLSGWTETDYYSDNGTDTKTYFTTGTWGTELYMGDARLSQTVSGLEEGIYKVTLQGFVRQGWADTIVDGLTGYDLSIGFLQANGYQINLNPWATEADLTNKTPDGTGNAFTDGRTYANELYTYVGGDGTLELSINCPDILAGGWMIFKNLTLTYYGEDEYTNDVTWKLANPSFEVDNVVENLEVDTSADEGGTARHNGDNKGAWIVESLTGWDLSIPATVDACDLMTKDAAATDNNLGTPGEAADGTYMLYLKDTWTGDNKVSASVKQTVSLPAGDYKLTVDSKFHSGGATAALVAGDNSTAIKVNGTSGGSSSADTIFSSEEWTTNTVKFTVATDGDVTIGVEITFTNNAPGSILLDNFKLYSAEEIEETISWTMTSAGWGTMILPFAATLDDGLTAYSCSGTEESTDETGNAITVVSLSEAESPIVANTPYIIGGTANTYSFKGVPTNEKETYTVGYLTGTLVDLAVAKGAAFATDGTQYLLQNHEDDGEGLAFYPIVEEKSAEATLDAYHCYLTLDENSSPSGARVYIGFPDSGEATGIVAVEGAEAEGNGAIYDLSGRKVSKAVKGVYIQNGKKVLVK